MRRLGLPSLLLVAAGLALGACGAFGSDPRQYACPDVFILGDAGELVRFEPGEGRDITDILFEARIVNFTGSCEYTEEGVDIELQVSISVERGPANRQGRIDFSYFVAIPEFRPQPEGKRTLPVRGTFAEDRSRLVYQDEVEMFIPLENGADGPGTEIVLGFQLTPAEIEYNRSVRTP